MIMNTSHNMANRNMLLGALNLIENIVLRFSEKSPKKHESSTLSCSLMIRDEICDRELVNITYANYL